MSPNGKWLEGIAPNADVADAAKKALGDRLAAVVCWLPAAAYCSGLDSEHVHRLRVSTRRATAAWRLFELWLPKKPARRIKKWLKEIRDSAGEARDLDVLGERLRREMEGESNGVLAEIENCRTQVQPDISRAADRARRHDRLAGQIKKLLAGIDPCCNKRSCDECAPFQKWAVSKLRELTTDFFKNLPAHDAPPAALHEFRIRAKSLRYAIELLAGAFEPELREVHYPIVEELQEMLGTINDHATAAERLEDWSKRKRNSAIREQLLELSANEIRQMELQVRKFHDWWTAGRAELLRSGLAAVASPSRDRTVLAY